MSPDRPHQEVTQDALDRVQDTARRELGDFKELWSRLRDADDKAFYAAIAAVAETSAAAMHAAEKAIIKADTATEKRFEGVNEFRGTLEDQQRTFIPRSEAELRIAAVESRITAIEKSKAVEVGVKHGGRELWAWIVGALGAAVLLWNALGPST